jgi:hypothetical protein
MIMTAARRRLFRGLTRGRRWHRLTLDQMAVARRLPEGWLQKLRRPNQSPRVRYRITPCYRETIYRLLEA